MLKGGGRESGGEREEETEEESTQQYVAGDTYGLSKGVWNDKGCSRN